MIKRLILFLFVVIFVILYLIFFSFGIDIFDESWRFLTNRFGSYFGGSLSVIIILSMIAIIVVAFVLLKIGSSRS